VPQPNRPGPVPFGQPPDHRTGTSTATGLRVVVDIITCTHRQDPPCEAIADFGLNQALAGLQSLMPSARRRARRPVGPRNGLSRHTLIIIAEPTLHGCATQSRRRDAPA
jgi:hypothetical protein